MVTDVSPLYRKFISQEGPYPSASLSLPSAPPLLAAQMLTSTIFTCQCSRTFGENQKLPSGWKRWGPRQKDSKKSWLQTGVVWQEGSPAIHPAVWDVSWVSQRALRVPSLWRKCCLSPSRLEQDIKKLKADLQASRQVEQELRSQISSLSSTERGIRSEMGQLRQENELLQNKYVHLSGLWRARRPHHSFCFQGLEHKTHDYKGT